MEFITCLTGNVMNRFLICMPIGMRMDTVVKPRYGTCMMRERIDTIKCHPATTKPVIPRLDRGIHEARAIELIR